MWDVLVAVTRTWELGHDSDCVWEVLTISLAVCVCLFVCLSRTSNCFSYLATFTITDDRAANLNLCSALTAFSSEGSFTCHTYCDTGPPFIRSWWLYVRDFGGYHSHLTVVVCDSYHSDTTMVVCEKFSWLSLGTWQWMYARVIRHDSGCVWKVLGGYPSVMIVVVCEMFWWISLGHDSGCMWDVFGHDSGCMWDVFGHDSRCMWDVLVAIIWTRQWLYVRAINRTGQWMFVGGFGCYYSDRGGVFFFVFFFSHDDSFFRWGTLTQLQD
jgi:hypothetical protein